MGIIAEFIPERIGELWELSRDNWPPENYTFHSDATYFLALYAQAPKRSHGGPWFDIVFFLLTLPFPMEQETEPSFTSLHIQILNSVSAGRRQPDRLGGGRDLESDWRLELRLLRGPRQGRAATKAG